MVGAPEPLLYLLGVHIALMQQQPNTMTIIVPQHPQQGREIAKKLEKEGQNVVLRSQYEKFKPRANIYVVDTLGDWGFITPWLVWPQYLRSCSSWLCCFDRFSRWAFLPHGTGNATIKSFVSSSVYL
ncbi:probable 3-deoxy-D-manno-octulosonic acid transferase, mitochondrial isoform X5 [Glycine soja]|uniref:probable 3-deoxy-D-manno-octulosonic acid transferase, mitochondrial isoform X5 n=1 Tax=Glycine soja TaxID=3848 RepID=UPI00103BD0B8|nr:probable 3-deoxy-D-manno-octulosonic acid transferase, mitochondrial isoform X5 [Glycine soja]